MKMLEIYVHTQDGVEPQLFKLGEDSTVKQVLESITKQGGFGGKSADDFLVFVEDRDEPLEHHRNLCECEVRHRHHLHCHQCRKVRVSVFYNGEHHESFAPSATVKRVLKWAIKAFGLTPADAVGKLLVLKAASDQELPLDAHIGSFTDGRHCSVDLCLTAPVEVQG